MARLYLFAEGQTEQTFADIVLKPHLASVGVYMHRPVIVAVARRKGRVLRGGGRKYLPMKNDILRFLKQDKDRQAFFTTMIDLYAIAQDFPGLAEAERLRSDPLQRVQMLEASFANDIGDSRFLPFVQLHEYESILFTDVKPFGFFYEGSEDRIADLQRIAEGYGSPEMIDDSPQAAPSKRIIAKFPEYRHAKPTVGPLVASLIGLLAIRSSCPHFNMWLTRIEQLGSAT